MADQHASTQHIERSVNDNRASQSTPAPAVTKPPAPEPTRGERWRIARPTKMIAFWLCLGAIVLTMIVGFTWGGWTTKDAAQKQANTIAQAAVVQRLGTICVAQFGLDAEHAQKLAALQALSTGKRSSFISDGGWATMPGEAAPDSKVVSECVKQVLVTASK